MDLNLAKLFDIDGLKALFDAFHRATEIAVSVVSLDGEILTSSGWQRVCSDFYRYRPSAKKECLRIGTRANKNLFQGKDRFVYHCPRGLVDAAMPIVVNLAHVANLFTGQVFFEPPDEKRIAKYKRLAAKWDFDEQAYLEALFEVPVISKERFTLVLDYQKQMARLIGEMGSNRLRLNTAGDVPAAVATDRDTTDRGEDGLAASTVELRYRQLFESANDAILIIKDGIVTDCNQKALDLFKTSREEMIGLTPAAFSPEIQPDGRSSKDVIEEQTEKVENGESQFFEWRHAKADQTTFDAEISITPFNTPDYHQALVVIRDISHRKAIIRSLEEREKELDEKSRYLEKINQALKASLDHREVEKRAVEENMLTHLKRFIFPYIEELSNCGLDSDARAYLNIVETNLNDIVSRSSKSVFWQYLDLTPTEVRIADLVRNGKNSKAIAELLGLSPSSIQWHRKNIREKLGLTNKKINLHTYLASLAE